MKLRQLATTLSLAFVSAIAFSTPVQAFSFSSNYTQALSGQNAAKGDIWLNSITLEDDTVITDFSLINHVTIQANDLHTGGNTGAASADIGDLATTGTKEEKLSKASAESVLNNLNLNNIIDTEDKGSFVLDLKFEQAVDNIFLYERGMNSRIDIQALDADGNAIGNLLQLPKSSEWQYAGFKLNTQEINKNSRVGSIGVSLADLGLTTGYVSAVRVSSHGRPYKGPDFKIIGSAAAKDIPEPSALLGLGALVAGMVATKRRHTESPVT